MTVVGVVTIAAILLVLRDHTKELQCGESLVTRLGGGVVLRHALLWPGGPPEAVVQHELQHLVGNSK